MVQARYVDLESLTWKMWLPIFPPQFSIFLFKFNNIKYWFLHLGWCFRGKTVTSTVTLTVERFVLTYRNYLIRDKPTSTFLFRILIPQDLRDYFEGRSQFKISLKNGIKNESLVFSKLLYFEVQSIFQNIRMGKESKITLRDIQNILREKVERTILHSRHIVTDTNTFVESEVP